MPSVSVAFLVVLDAVPASSSVVDDLFDMPLPELKFSGVVGSFKKAIK